MSETDKLRAAVQLAATGWLASDGGDSNLLDVQWIAEKIWEGLAVTLPTDLPSRPVGVNAFECLEKNLLADPQDRVLRNIPVTDVADRIVNLINPLREILSFSDVQNVVVSMYAWHGCMQMGKLLRCTYILPLGRQALYTPQMRRDGYAQLEREWVRHETAGNPWVRYGVSLTRLMEQGRKKDNFDFEVHENWISRNSPYWQT